MRIAYLPLFLIACSGSSELLGGQEGEPMAPPAAPPMPEDITDSGVDADPDDGCLVVAHCKGDGWCAQYSEASMPDLEVVCAENWAEGPCAGTDALGICPGSVDNCSQVFYFTRDAEQVCPAP